MVWETKVLHYKVFSVQIKYINAARTTWTKAIIVHTLSVLQKLFWSTVTQLWKKWWLSIFFKLTFWNVSSQAKLAVSEPSLPGTEKMCTWEPHLTCNTNNPHSFTNAPWALCALFSTHANWRDPIGI